MSTLFTARPRMPLSHFLSCGTLFYLVLRAALYFHLLTLYTTITSDDLPVPFPFFLETSLEKGSLLSPAPVKMEPPNQLSCCDFAGVHNGFSVSYTGYPAFGGEEKGGAHAPVSSEHHYSTLALDWEFVRVPKLDQKLYFHLDCLLAATITVENFDTNWTPHSFSKCFRNVLCLVFQTSLLHAKVWAPHLLPSPSRIGESFPS